MSMVLSNKHHQLKPNLAYYITSFLATSAICEIILILIYGTLMDMGIMVPFFIVLAALAVIHAIAYTVKLKQFTSSMSNVIESLPLTSEQKHYLANELKKKTRRMHKQDEICQVLLELVNKIEKNAHLTQTEINAINKIVFGNYPIKATIKNDLHG
ncbi:putative neutral ceramidase superfamily lipid hydrolase [Scopulibacillus daqui]|uniref:Neutral ceramidase superfamily lipid hydrolase n=1 Tax=Scopulibacillus daqui TaxID=1469162 RepID=A0ABS2Q3F4_9BACL|nr:hypothetical protein [Scopulibacillus daqui]MBM7646057.1 putative neutral ceramidase superfamily lipid hydrolase [Scopulibacillus daqui]